MKIILLFTIYCLSTVDGTDKMVVKESLTIPFKFFELFVLQHMLPLGSADILRKPLNKTDFSLRT